MVDDKLVRKDWFFLGLHAIRYPLSHWPRPGSWMYGIVVDKEDSFEVCVNIYFGKKLYVIKRNRYV